MSWLKRIFEKKDTKALEGGLEKSRQSFLDKLSRAIAGRSTIDQSFMDELEQVFMTSDVGVATTIKILDALEAKVAQNKYLKSEEIYDHLKSIIADLMTDTPEELNTHHHKPYIMMVVGVNGVGKTTTIGKLAYQFKKQGLNVVLGAADTFRAAAVDQLGVWAQRVGVPIISQGMGADPASVAFDTVQSAKAQNADVVIIDTAGRLHNKVNLMNELSKIKRVIQKVYPDAPHEIVLVLDGSTGQNAFEQAKQFTAATDVNALAITKLDGSAKGGVVIGISNQFAIPVKYIGLGEGIEDFQWFDKNQFIDSFIKL